MKTFTLGTLASLALFGAIIFSQGCTKTESGHSADDGHNHGTPSAKGDTGHDDHAALHKTKYNEVLVEFPGHKYSMEIIDEKETTGLVTAFITDAHFEPMEVDTKEVKLNFMVGGQPKTYTLTRIETEKGKPATFTLTDMELATLNCEGWEGEATASVEIGGKPHNSKLVKLGHHEH